MSCEKRTLRLSDKTLICNGSLKLKLVSTNFNAEFVTGLYSWDIFHVFDVINTIIPQKEMQCVSIAKLEFTVYNVNK